MKRLFTCALILLFAACGSEERLGSTSKNAASVTTGATSAVTTLVSITPATSQTLSDDGVITLCFSGKVHPAADQYGDAFYYSDPPSAGPIYAVSNNPDNFHVDIASQYNDSNNCLQLTLQQTASNATLLAAASTLALTYVKDMMLDENNQPVVADAYGNSGESSFTLTWNLPAALTSVSPDQNTTLDASGDITLCFSGMVHPAVDPDGQALYYDYFGPVSCMVNTPNLFPGVFVDMSATYDDSTNCLHLQLLDDQSNSINLAGATQLTLTFIKAMMLDADNNPVAVTYGNAGESQFALTWSLAGTTGN